MEEDKNKLKYFFEVAPRGGGGGTLLGTCTPPGYATGYVYSVFVLTDVKLAVFQGRIQWRVNTSTV